MKMFKKVVLLLVVALMASCNDSGVKKEGIDSVAGTSIIIASVSGQVMTDLSTDGYVSVDSNFTSIINATYAGANMSLESTNMSRNSDSNGALESFELKKSENETYTLSFTTNIALYVSMTEEANDYTLTFYKEGKGEARTSFEYDFESDNNRLVIGFIQNSDVFASRGGRPVKEIPREPVIIVDDDM